MNIYIFGLGAIGSNLILQLMKQYPEFNYIGIDYDKIEERNIKTQAYFLEQVGMPKVHAIPILAQRFSRKINYSPLDMKIDGSIKMAITSNIDNIFIDCFDNSASRKAFNHGAIPDTLHIGFSPQYAAEIIWHENYTVPNDIPPNQNDICEMTEATSFIHFVVNFAVMNLTTYINESKKENYIITNKWKIKRL